jgi:toxin ParE1/3/4
MLVRWPPAAADDLQQISEYIRADDPDAAQRVAAKIYDRAATLGTHPHHGRRGRVAGTRELPLPPLPFIVVYRILEGAAAVEIVNIIHGAQRWPPADRLG